MKIINQLILLLATVLFSVPLFAQGEKTGMADVMRSNGRIYVVVAVVLTILIGLIVYVVRIDRKLSKLEKEN
ncbi:MAG: CcmD family protein [Chitinophagaceae bacterium]|nr:CcmD family protein [Chitinophagaceae bacterium]MBK8951603.1 CcmD family protein [Chitinophagaceae bacterium]